MRELLTRVEDRATRQEDEALCEGVTGPNLLAVVEVDFATSLELLD